MNIDREDYLKLCFMEVLERLLAEVEEVKGLPAAYAAYTEAATQFDERYALWGEAALCMAVAANRTA